MKRKLNEENAPTPVNRESSGDEPKPTFDDLRLDLRILQAVAKEGFVTPTAIQSKSVPLALEGKDVLARANTGSGKTAAYVLPILNAILRRKATSPLFKATTALILVPTRELADQVTRVCVRFSAFCAKEVRIVNLTQKISDVVQRSLLADLPDVVVATPARASLNLGTSALSLDSLAHLVIDEADLVLSYGYEDDLQNIAKLIPKGIQTFLMSATLTTEVNTLMGTFCKDPAILLLEEVTPDDSSVSQYVVKCTEEEKFLLVYVIFKLKLVKGKCIIFVGDIDRCYRLKLFLEQFGTKSCILNSELPVNSRIHVVEEFNKNVYDIIIATDEHEVFGVSQDNKSTKRNRTPNTELTEPEIVSIGDTVMANDDSKELLGDATLNGHSDDSHEVDEPKKKKRKVVKKDKEYGISRGIDFQNVACVLNFDLPISSKSYIHRIGRTARAGKTGMALSFVIPAEHYRKHKPTSIPSTQHDETILAQITTDQAKRGKEIKPYHFDMSQVEAFRYRMTDALRAVTRLAIRSARTRELRQELFQSEKLKRHFEENPEELRQLRHDGETRVVRIQPHLRHVPDYLMPKGGQKAIAGRDIGFVGMGKTSESENRRRKASAEKRRRRMWGKKAAGVGVGVGVGKGRGRDRGRGKGKDPLKSF